MKFKKNIITEWKTLMESRGFGGLVESPQREYLYVCRCQKNSVHLKTRDSVMRILLGKRSGTCRTCVNHHRSSVVMGRYGVANVMKLKCFRQKIRDTCMSRYGVDNVMKNRDIQLKYTHSLLSNYGVTNPSHHARLLEKNQKARFQRKEYIFPSGKRVWVQGYEWLCLNDLVALGIPEQDIHVGLTEVPVIAYFFDGISRRYFPDIYICSQNMIIEVKSRYTMTLNPEQTHAKLAACINQGYQVQLRVYDGKKIVDMFQDDLALESLSKMSVSRI